MKAPKYSKDMLGSCRLHMGNGDASAARAYELTSDLHQAIQNISAIEQYGLMGGSTEMEKHIVENMREQVDITAAKIYFALTGKIPTEVKG